MYCSRQWDKIISVSVLIFFWCASAFNIDSFHGLPKINGRGGRRQLQWSALSRTTGQHPN